MKRPVVSRKTFFVIVIIFFFVVNIVFLCFHYIETSVVNKFIENHALKFPGQSKKNAFLISENLRAEFEVDTTKWKINPTDFAKLPFFRTSVKKLLSSREALCGGGARVLCRILLESGYNATRVVLFTRNFGAMGHVIVSIMVNGKEYFIDTLNSPDDLNELLKKYDINSDVIKIIPYKQRYNKKFIDVRYSKDSLISKFQRNYIAYSYEAVPFSKLLNSIGFDVYVLNLKRPPFIFSYFAESVNLLYSLTFSLLYIFIVSLGYLIYFGAKFYLYRKNKILRVNA